MNSIDRDGVDLIDDYVIDLHCSAYMIRLSELFLIVLLGVDATCMYAPYVCWLFVHTCCINVKNYPFTCCCFVGLGMFHLISPHINRCFEVEGVPTCTKNMSVHASAMNTIAT